MKKLCSKHPRYQAKRKPRADCVQCWHAWYAAENQRRYDYIDQWFLNDAEFQKKGDEK